MVCQWGLLGTANDGILCPTLLESSKVDVEIRGFVAQISASLTYRNSTGYPLQVQYSVPVDEGAAVYQFEAHLDGRTITAACMEKKKAEAVYKEAVQSGKTAILARQNIDSGDVLQLSLGNLPRESTAELKLKMVLELRVLTDGGVSFILPTFLKPRYRPAVPGGQFPLSDLDERSMYVHNQFASEVKARVSGAHKIARIISHTDALNVNIHDDDTIAEITQDGGTIRDHDWTMVLYYANPYQTHVLRETCDRSATGLMKDDLIMVNLFPEVAASSYSCKNEIIFVVDRSGSMQGSNIQSARATLLLFLKSLPSGCYFNIISFGSSFSLLFPNGSEVYTEESLAKACQLQRGMDADMGGTEIFEPFKSIYSQPPKPGYARQILLISDGSVWNVGQLTELVRRHVGETRVFAVGVGHGASTALIKGVARAGRGQYEMVMQQDKLQHKVMGLVSCMVQETVQDVRVSCQLDPPTRLTLVPKVPPIIFGGQHLTLYARVPHDTLVKKISIHGVLGAKEVNMAVEEGDIKVVHDGEMSLHRLAARAQINQWQVEGEEDVGDDMVALSLASGVVSSRTALVGVDQEGHALTHQQADKVSGFSFGSAQPQMMQSNCTFGSALPPPGCAPLGPGCAPPGPGCAGPGSGFTFGSAPRGMMQSNCTFGAFSFGSSAQPQMKGFAAAPPPPPQQMMKCYTYGSAKSKAKKKIKSDSSELIYGSAQPEAMESDSADFCLESTQPQAAAEQGLMAIVGKQRFNGSWTLEDISQLSGLDLAELVDRNKAKTREGWATVIALALLEIKYGSERDEWTLLATKARFFLASCGEDVETLMQIARTLLARE